jgi:hypothetical protein
VEVTLKTGCAGESHKCNVEWFDENSVDQLTVVEVNIRDQDKPRVLEVVVDGMLVFAAVPSESIKQGMFCSPKSKASRSQMLRLINYSSHEPVLINSEEISKVRSAERGTAVVYLRDGSNVHVLESVSDIERVI